MCLGEGWSAIRFTATIEVPLTKSRENQREQQCTPDECAQLRSALGVALWTLKTRPEISYNLSRVASMSHQRSAARHRTMN